MPLSPIFWVGSINSKWGYFQKYWNFSFATFDKSLSLYCFQLNIVFQCFANHHILFWFVFNMVPQLLDKRWLCYRCVIGKLCYSHMGWQGIFIVSYQWLISKHGGKLDFILVMFLATKQTINQSVNIFYLAGLFCLNKILTKIPAPQIFQNIPKLVTKFTWAWILDT